MEKGRTTFTIECESGSSNFTSFSFF